MWPYRGVKGEAAIGEIQVAYAHEATHDHSDGAALVT